MAGAPADRRADSVGAAGGVVFAATMMIMIGLFQFFEGLVAIIDDDFFVVAPNYTYEFDTTAWGWIHLILGVLIVVAGIYLVRGSTVAGVVATVLAVLVAIANFVFIPYYPVWSLLVIALCVFVIWAISRAILQS